MIRILSWVRRKTYSARALHLETLCFRGLTFVSLPLYNSYSLLYPQPYLPPIITYAGGFSIMSAAVFAIKEWNINMKA